MEKETIIELTNLGEAIGDDEDLYVFDSSTWPTKKKYSRLQVWQSRKYNCSGKLWGPESYSKQEMRLGVCMMKAQKSLSFDILNLLKKHGENGQR